MECLERNSLSSSKYVLVLPPPLLGAWWGKAVLRQKPSCRLWCPGRTAIFPPFNVVLALTLALNQLKTCHSIAISNASTRPTRIWRYEYILAAAERIAFQAFHLPSLDYSCPCLTVLMPQNSWMDHIESRAYSPFPYHIHYS